MGQSIMIELSLDKTYIKMRVKMLQIEEDEKNGRMILRLKGRLDATSAPQLDVRIKDAREEGIKYFVIDFKEVDYLSSAGMRLLLAYTKRLANENGFLHLFGMHKEILEIIKMGGFEEILRIFADEQQALEKE